MPFEGSHMEKICAAGVSTRKKMSVKDLMSYYSLADTVNALKGDLIRPVKDDFVPQKRKKKEATMAELINPKPLSKFETIAQDMKETIYPSYWKQKLAATKDPTPMLPLGFKIEEHCFGRKIPPDEYNAYRLLYPTYLTQEIPKSQEPGVQTQRGYCTPAFNKDLTYGEKQVYARNGAQVKCCLLDDHVINGTAGYQTMCNAFFHFQDRTLNKPGRPPPAYRETLNHLPLGFTFGKQTPVSNIPECLTTCNINPVVADIRKSLAHINNVRKNIKPRWQYNQHMFRNLFLKLKWIDINHAKVISQWLPKETIYKNLVEEKIILDPELIEPLLRLFQAFDGENIKYRTLLGLVNFREPIPDLPKICDVEPQCLDFQTTYNMMVSEGLCKDFHPPTAGVPTVRHDVDIPPTPEGRCRSDRIYLGDETDVRACIEPSIMSKHGVTHRDIYTQREPDKLRKIFERAGKTFTDEEFQKLWKQAQIYHPDGLVCIETFDKVLTENVEKKPTIQSCYDQYL